MISLQVNRLSKRFGNVAALHEVSFAVEGGEMFGYSGANGAGKTTTLRILPGLVFADDGGIRLGAMHPRHRPRIAARAFSPAGSSSRVT